MVTIKQNRVMNLNISFDRDFNGGTLMEVSTVILNPIVNPKNQEELLLFVEYKSEFGNGTTDFEMTCEVAIGFQMKPIKDIKREDLFKCIELTKEHLQGILNATFLKHPTPNVPPILFDDISDTLDEHIAHLNK